MGSLVLIQEELTPRLNWPLGRIVQLFPGRDGVSRTAEIKTDRGTLVRSIQRLHHLEMDSPDALVAQEVESEGDQVVEEEGPTVTTRSGRRVKLRMIVPPSMI